MIVIPALEHSHTRCILQAVAAGDVRGAVNTLRRAGLLAEAAAVASVQLLPGDAHLQVCQLYISCVPAVRQLCANGNLK